MEDLYLMIVTFAAFAFCFYVTKKFDDFMDLNRKQISGGYKEINCTIRIAAENPMLLDAAAPALEYCSDINPYMKFNYSSGRVHRLLQRVSKGTIDIVLLSEEAVQELSNEFDRVHIAYKPTPKMVTSLGLTVENINDDCTLYAVWNKHISSRNRDRVLFILENEHCRLKTAYCDYL